MKRVPSFCALAAPFVTLLSLSVPDTALAQFAPPPQPPPSAPPPQPPPSASTAPGPAAPAGPAPAPTAPAPVPPAGVAAPPADFSQPIPYSPSLPRAVAADDEDVESAAPPRKRRRALSESRPARLQWQPGEAIPPGYSVADGPDKRFVIGGITTFGALYVSSVIGGLIGVAAGAGDEFSPLFVPLVGPFLTVATSNADRAAAYVLALDGIGQIAGGTFFLVGFLKKDHWLKRDDLAPQLSIGPHGASLRMEF